jgi:hypothetical protein
VYPTSYKVTLKLLRKQDTSEKREQKRRKLTEAAAADEGGERAEKSVMDTSKKCVEFKAGEDVMHTPPVLWRWEEQVNQVPHRVTILKVNESAGSGVGGASKSAGDGTSGAAVSEPGVRTYDVLDRYSTPSMIQYTLS